MALLEFVDLEELLAGGVDVAGSVVGGDGYHACQLALGSQEAVLGGAVLHKQSVIRIWVTQFSKATGVSRTP